MTNQDQFYERLSAEYDIFIEQLKTKTPDEILVAAYEKVCKEEIVIIFENNEFSEGGYAALLQIDNPLDTFYKEWLDTDSADMEAIRDCVKSTVKRETGFELSGGYDEHYDATEWRDRADREEPDEHGDYTIEERIAAEIAAKSKPTAWEKEQLLKKALESERNADLWLFVACHFICGWRGTDIVRLPMPKLNCTGASMREQIASGVFDTQSIINEIEFRLRYTPLMPQKTEMYENIPELKLFVPESLRQPVGIILSVAASHHETTKTGEHFLEKSGNRSRILSFFGKEFMDACGGHSFSSRRANKSYLQGIEMMANPSASNPKGYMLAAIARSHKSGFGSLPETTDVYLRDAKFSGYCPDFIAREMFERGVFSLFRL